MESNIEVLDHTSLSQFFLTLSSQFRILFIVCMQGIKYYIYFGEIHIFLFHFMNLTSATSHSNIPFTVAAKGCLFFTPASAH